MTTAFLIIDAQYDFCNPKGTLFVPNAENDAARMAQIINDHSKAIDQIFATLDTHQVLDISHPGFWKNERGDSPEAFSTITHEDVIKKRWIPVIHPERSLRYLEELEKNGEYLHTIWPEHCLQGTPGATLDDGVAKAAENWAHRHVRNIEFVIKGTNPLTEHFGAFAAQVPIDGAPETLINITLIKKLKKFDRIWMAGEARSHCVATSLKQMIQFAPTLVPKTILITDAMSDVTGMGELARPIYAEARKLGVTEAKSGDL